VAQTTGTQSVTDVIAVGGWPRHLVAADGAIWATLQLPGSGSVIRIDATTLQVTDTIPVGVAPLHMFPTEDGLWVLDNDGGGLLLVDTSTRQVTDSIEILDQKGQEIMPVLVGETMWVFTNTSGPATIVEVDLAAREVVSGTPVGPLPWWAEAIDGAIWFYAPGGQVGRFDLETHESAVFGDENVGITEACCIALGDAIWLVHHNEPLLRFSLRTRVVTDKLELEVGNTGGIAAAGAIWLPNRDSGAINRIDPTLRTVTDEIRVGLEPTTPVFADGAIWVPNQGDGTVSRIDIETRQVIDIIQVGNRPTTPWALNGAIWVPNLEDGTITRIQTQ
jgi:YVTN family beta-propeller protein